MKTYTRDEFIRKVWNLINGSLCLGEVDHYFSNMPYVQQLNDSSAEMVASSITNTLEAGWW